MKTDYFIMSQHRGTDRPVDARCQREDYETAVADAQKILDQAPVSVVVVWARRGTNQWPVRILFPGAHTLGIPLENPAGFALDTSHPVKVEKIA